MEMGRRQNRRGCEHVIVHKQSAFAYVVISGIPCYVCEECKDPFAAVADEPGRVEGLEDIPPLEKYRLAVG